MTKVMEGIRVLEVAQFTFVPAAGGVMTDWGADVIKVEHPVRGDSQRNIQMLQRLVADPRRNALMQHPNRGKRSVGIDISTEEGREILYAIAASCDVFLTNYLPGARRKLQIDLEDIRKHSPKIIYVRGSALGDKGPEREKGGFDSTAFWARGGSAMLVSPEELEVPLTQPGPAYGDTIGGMNIAGGIAAALLHRERTGEALEVDVSLLSSGVWATACSITVSVELGEIPFSNPMPAAGTKEGATNPFVGVFRTSDGQAINLTVLTPGTHLHDTFEHLDVPELADDPRFNTDEALIANTAEASMLIAQSVAQKPLSYWLDRLKTMKGQWAPYQTVLDVASDEQVIANDMIFEVQTVDSGKPMRLVANPVQFNHVPVENKRAPEAFEHTDIVLGELGIDPDRIAALKASKAVG